jgi:ABC-type transport system involved in cytochrome c biogenesis ATPase subunit
VNLELKDISMRVGGETHLYPLDVKLVPGTINVLLGPTQAGKTTLMRVMAGLDRPTAGRILADGKDVTGVSVRERRLAMVYQQFVNYPAMTVFDNIAAPLRLQRCPDAEVRERVTRMAEKLHIAHLLQRLPARCPAASSSAARWRGRWSSARRWYCWMNRWSTSTTSCARNCVRNWRRCLPMAAPRWCTPPPSRRKRCCWAGTPW